MNPQQDDKNDESTAHEELRLELEAPVVRLSLLTSVAGTFSGLLREVARELSPGKPIEWAVRLEPGSVAIPVRPHEVDPILEKRLVAVVAEGLAAVEKEAHRPRYFNDQALAQARALANFATRENPIRVHSATTNVHLTTQLIAHVDQVSGEGDPRIGTVEGVLEEANVHSNRPSFEVWERMTGEQVKCFGGDEVTVDDLREALGRRVAVRGRIRSSKSGTKRRIDVKQLRVFPGEEDLPTADEVRGILKAS